MNYIENNRIISQLLPLHENKKSSEQEVLFLLLADDRNNFDNDKMLMLDDIADNIEKIKDKVKTINICVPYEKIPTKQFETINNFYMQTKNFIKCNILVNHKIYGNARNLQWQKTWDMETIIKANNCINKVCETIKQADLSPAEALAYVHDFVSTIVNYSSSKEKKYDSNDQFFVGAFLNNPEFVCAGYSSLEKEIIDNLSIAGLSCNIVCMEAYNLDSNCNELHCRAVVDLKDDKYNIYQTVFDDPTWDNVNKINLPIYSNFMMAMCCHEDNMSKYDFDKFSLIEKRPQETGATFSDNYIDYKYDYNDNKKPIDQSIIEKIQFNMLSKACPKQTFEELFVKLEKMAKLSYRVQQNGRYKMCLKSDTLQLSKKEAMQIYEDSHLACLKNEKMIDDLI